MVSSLEKGANARVIVDGLGKNSMNTFGGTWLQPERRASIKNRGNELQKHEKDYNLGSHPECARKEETKRIWGDK